MFKVFFVLVLSVGLLAVMFGQAAAITETGPAIAKLTSHTHPDPDTWYVDINPQFEWNSAVDITPLGSLNSPGQARAVAISGNRAYLADGNSGLQVIDITNPTSPVLLGSLDTGGSARGVDVTGNYVYVADDSDLRVIDVSNPAAPVLQKTVSAGAFYTVAVQNQYAYVAGGPGDSGGLRIFDITDPTSPKEKPGHIPGGATGGQSVAVRDQYAYMADGSAGLKIINISNPNQPLVVTGACDTPGGARDVAVDGNYAYVADSLSGMQIIDISDPANPQLVGSGFDTNNSRSVEASNGYAYLGDDFNGLYVIDVSDPENLVQVANHDFPGYAYGITLAGGIAYVAADYSGGLQIIGVHASDFSYLLDQTADSTPDDISEGGATSASFVGVPEGIAYFHVKARDMSGNWGPVAHRKVQMIADYTAPQVNSIEPSGDVGTDSAVVSAYFTDASPSSGIDPETASLTVSGGVVSGCNANADSISCTVSNLTLGTHTVDVSVSDKAGNTGTGSGSFTSIDAAPPIISGIAPTGKIYTESAVVSAYFADPSPSSGINPSSASLTVYGATVSDCSSSLTGITCNVSGLSAGYYDIDVSVSDNAGNIGTGSGGFEKIDGLKYHWTWYDNIYLRNWVLISNPAGAADEPEFELFIGGNLMGLANLGSGNGVVPQGQTLTPAYPGVMDGPVTAVSKTGSKAILSQRSLLGDSFEEVLATEEGKMSDHFYWTWYDMQTAGFRNWVMIANPGSEPVRAEVFIAGELMTDSASGHQYFDIAPGGRATPTFPGIMGGPVEVKAHTPGGNWDVESERRNVIASQRVLSNYGVAFNEMPGIPAGELSDSYIWTWYDMQSPGFQDWVLLANPGSDTVRAEIRIAGELMKDRDPESASYNQYYFDIAPGTNVTPVFKGVKNGPLEVSADGTVIASQRIIAGPSFGEVPGYPTTALTDDYHWTWYDMKSAGSANWVMIANPGSEAVRAEVYIAGELMKDAAGNQYYDIAPGANVTPRYDGVMAGPVEVKSTGGDVMVSQRVLWNGHFNEVLGTVLD